DRAPAVRDVDDAVLHDRSGFQIAELVAAGPLDAAERDREREPEVLDRIDIDLLERRKAVALVIAVMEQPGLRLLFGRERALEAHVGRPRRRERRRRQQRSRDRKIKPSAGHDALPLYAGAMMVDESWKNTTMAD